MGTGMGRYSPGRRMGMRGVVWDEKGKEDKKHLRLAT